MDKIQFLNKTYMVREIKLPEIGNVLISTTDLNDILMINGSEYISEEAQILDELIYFFVEENEINISENDLVKLVTLQAA